MRQANFRKRFAHLLVAQFFIEPNRCIPSVETSLDDSARSQLLLHPEHQSRSQPVSLMRLSDRHLLEPRWLLAPRKNHQTGDHSLRFKNAEMPRRSLRTQALVRKIHAQWSPQNRVPEFELLYVLRRTMFDFLESAMHIPKKKASAAKREQRLENSETKAIAASEPPRPPTQTSYPTRPSPCLPAR